MIYRIGICDDEKGTCAEIEDYITGYFEDKLDEADVSVWYSGESCCDSLQKGTALDLLFLDIELPVKNGVETGQYIREDLNDKNMYIIYISSKTSYAMDLFKIHPYDFLIKPIDGSEVEKMLSGILAMTEQDKKCYSYTNRKVLYRIPYGEIEYLESRKHHIVIHLVSGEEREFVGKIKKEAVKLPAQFAKIAQSYIINIKYIRSCAYDHVVMSNGEVLNISQPNRADFRKKMRLYSEGGL